MFDAKAISHLFTGSTAGWATFVVVLVALIKVWPAIKAKIIEAKASEATIAGEQWKRLELWCDRLEIRIKALEEEIARCHHERDEWRARALKAEAASEGIGLVRTAQAIADAEERNAEKRRKDGEG